MRKFPVLIPMILAGVLLLSVGACAPAVTPVSPSETEPAFSGQGEAPGSGSGAGSAGPYPVGTPAPVEEPTAAVGGPYPAAGQGAVPFIIDRPLSPGMTTVSGSGPAGVPIRVLLEDGTALAEIIIGDDGRFELQVAALESGQRVGLMLDDLTGTPWNPDELSSSPYHGPGSVNIPALGFFLDTVLVQ